MPSVLSVKMYFSIEELSALHELFSNPNIPTPDSLLAFAAFLESNEKGLRESEPGEQEEVKFTVPMISALIDLLCLVHDDSGARYALFHTEATKKIHQPIFERMVLCRASLEHDDADNEQ